MRKLAIAVLLLMFATVLAAQTPTGTIAFGATSGSCPQSTFADEGTATLDNNGNYSLPSALTALGQGTYCIRAVYSGDANFNSSTGYTTVVVTAFGKQNTVTALLATPSTWMAGQGTTLSGGVTPQ